MAIGIPDVLLCGMPIFYDFLIDTLYYHNKSYTRKSCENI